VSLLDQINNRIILRDPKSFARFYEQSYLNVFRYVMALCDGYQQEAEDITADAFLRAWQQRDQFVGNQQQAIGWVITIARHLLIDRLRVLNARPEETAITDDLMDDTGNLENRLIDSEQMQGVMEELRHLPIQQSEMVVLRYILGWKVKQIAAYADLSENHVSVTLRRVLQHIANNLKVEQRSDYGNSK
jgi:RNA polymerase sigma-70 factor (ECF subfamily)